MPSNTVLSQMRMFFCKQAVPESRYNKCNKIYNEKTHHYPLNIVYWDKYIEVTVNTKFLHLQIDNHLNRKNHIDQLVQKLSGECCAVRYLHCKRRLLDS
jgi:hypothetical protein